MWVQSKIRVFVNITEIVTTVNIIYSRNISVKVISDEYVLKSEKREIQSSMGAVRVVYNSNDKEVFGIACCYYANHVWFIIG